MEFGIAGLRFETFGFCGFGAQNVGCECGFYIRLPTQLDIDGGRAGHTASLKSCTNPRTRDQHAAQDLETALKSAIQIQIQVLKPKPLIPCERISDLVPRGGRT